MKRLNTYMNNDIKIKNKHGIDEYFKPGICDMCGKDIFVRKYDTRKFHFCKNSDCIHSFKIKQRDPVNYNILDKKETPEFYWLLGFIATDGTIAWPNITKYATSYVCQIKISLKDEDVVYKLQKMFGGIIHKYPKRNTITWVSRGKPFIEYLKSIGMSNNKTHTLNMEPWFNSLKEENKWNFVHGVIDGDGWIFNDKKRPTQACPTIGFCSGSKSFFNMIKSFLKITTKIQIRKRGTKTYKTSQYNKPFYMIKTTKTEIIENFKKNISASLSSIYLNRKFDILRKDII